MNALMRLLGWLRPAPATPEELRAEEEAERIRSDEESIKTAQLAAPPTMRDQYKWPRRLIPNCRGAG